MTTYRGPVPIVGVPAESASLEFTVLPEEFAPYNALILPMNSNGTYNFTVTWGDGASDVITTYNDPVRRHVYSTPGSYSVKMTGVYTDMNFEISYWGVGSVYVAGQFVAISVPMQGDRYYECILNNVGDSDNRPGTGVNWETYWLLPTYGQNKTHTLLRSVDLVVGDMGFTVLSFGGCGGITSIDGSLSNLKSLTTAVNMFSSCVSLTTIPSGIFDGSTGITSFNGTFKNSGIRAIPPGLFDKNVLATDFSAVFYYVGDYGGISEIPADLFKNNILATTFLECFLGPGLGLKTIPVGLFDTNILVTSFSGTFESSKLTAIPSGLFTYNTAVTDYQKTFAQCPDIVSAAPKLWLLVPEPNGTTCFLNDFSISNYEEIPADWK